ncbi:MAG TPA: hypothetical protein PLR06_14770, partial [Cyclobacteriaceae bacterium]|nr:hypothetical protein [Cyclobacteriaceae bacterium]
MKAVQSILFLLLISILPAPTEAQPSSKERSFTPVVVGGFNHDVIAEGTGKNSRTVTSQEMDAKDPSNFVLCTQAFASANKMPPGYGLPNDGRLDAQNKSFQLEPYGTAQPRPTPNPNVLYLMKNENGILRLDKPARFEKIAILGLATEGQATIDINLLFTDGTSRFSRGQVLPDWFDGPDAFYSGFGRVKRTSGVTVPIYYEGYPSNPRMYVIELNVPVNKTLFAVQFNNISNGDNPASNRAFIFALSGLKPVEPVTPVEKTIITPVQNPVTTPVVVSPVVTPAVVNSISLRGIVRDGKTNRPLKAKVSIAENNSS